MWRQRPTRGLLFYYEELDVLQSFSLGCWRVIEGWAGSQYFTIISPGVYILLVKIYVKRVLLTADVDNPVKKRTINKPGSFLLVSPFSLFLFRHLNVFLTSCTSLILDIHGLLLRKAKPLTYYYDDCVIVIAYIILVCRWSGLWVSLDNVCLLSLVFCVVIRISCKVCSKSAGFTKNKSLLQTPWRGA